MSAADLNTRDLLDRLVPVPDGGGDWAAVVRDAAPATVRRRRRFGLAAAVGIAVAAIALVILVAPSRHGGGSVVERALAAIGDGPVLHVVTQSPYPRYELLDLATGERRSVYEEFEEWSDPNLGVHWIVRAEGRVVYDSVWGTAERDPALTAFMTGYREALASGEARVVGEDTVRGSQVYWLQLGRSDSPEAEAQSRQVAVDKETFVPLALRWSHGGEVGPVEPILRINAAPEGSGDFGGVPKPKLFPDRGDVVGSTTITAGEAGGLLETPAVWAGHEAAGLPLSLVRKQELKMVYPASDGLPPQTTVGLSLVYGAVVNDHPDSNGKFIQISESSSPAFAYGWIPTDPPLAAGTLRVKEFSAAAGSTRGDWYRAELVVRGTYVALAGYDLDAIVVAAKALEPIR
jgi:hypothetical protein